MLDGDSTAGLEDSLYGPKRADENIVKKERGLKRFLHIGMTKNDLAKENLILRSNNADLAKENEILKSKNADLEKKLSTIMEMLAKINEDNNEMRKRLAEQTNLLQEKSFKNNSNSMDNNVSQNLKGNYTDSPKNDYSQERANQIYNELTKKGNGGRKVGAANMTKAFQTNYIQRDRDRDNEIILVSGATILPSMMLIDSNREEKNGQADEVCERYGITQDKENSAQNCDSASTMQNSNLDCSYRNENSIRDFHSRQWGRDSGVRSDSNDTHSHANSSHSSDIGSHSNTHHNNSHNYDSGSSSSLNSSDYNSSNCDYGSSSCDSGGGMDFGGF